MTGTVKKLALPTRIFHDKYSKAIDLKEEMLEQLSEAMKFNKELKAHVNRIFDSLNPVRVLSLFERMLQEVLDLPYYCQPRKALNLVYISSI